jgi:hypothetical protein
LPGKTEEHHEKSQSSQQVSNPAGIQTWNLPNISMNLNHYTDLLVEVERNSFGINWIELA